MQTIDVLVIGAGFGGLGMGIALQRAGRDSLVIVEKDAGVGGTWWANRYPGAACDIPSMLYSFSFAPKHDWSRRYPGQAEIAAYLEDCVRRFGLAQHLRLSTRVLAMDWDDAARRWHVEARDDEGNVLHWSARVVVSATGALSQPRLPELAGLDNFEGRVCHTARWDDSIGTAGQRVGVVGTGASAIQLVPQLVARGAQVTLFQRTPPWIIPKGDRPVGALARWSRAHLPLWAWLSRGLVYMRHEAAAPAFTRHPAWLRMIEPVARAYLRRKVPAGPLRDALTPRYRMGCKRILLADNFYPALLEPNARLVPAAVERVVHDGVVSEDGVHHALDALVLATGFDAAEGTLPFTVRGRGGADVQAQWRAHGPQAYLGSSLPGFPNLFLLVGPNTGLGHNSMIFMIESQLRYVMDAIGRLDRAAAIEVKPDATERYNAELQRRLPRTVWASGCRSWYQTRDGRITALWPGSTLEFRRRTRRLNAADHELTFSH